MAIKIFGQNDEPTIPDVYLKFSAEDGQISIDSVTKEGNWIRTLLYFTSEGLVLCSGAEEAGFPTTKQGRIKVVEN